MEESKTEKGSLNWYRRKSKFFKYLSLAIIFADDFQNSTKLNRIFPHIMDARGMGDFDKSPGNDNDIIENKDPEDLEFPENYRIIYNQGSFLKYLHQSSSFDTYIAKAVFFADDNNLSLIEKEYPLIVAAHAMDNWEEPPPSFAEFGYKT